MSRHKGNYTLSTTYDNSYWGPLDSRMLVPTKADLILESNWIPKGQTSHSAFNGLVTVVAGDPNPSNNGIYRLFDLNNPGASDVPDVTSYDNWHKMVELSDLESLIASLGGGIPEAPEDSAAYGRQNGQWVAVATKLDLSELAAKIEQGSTVNEIGYLIVKDIAERDALPTGTMIEGTEVYVNDLDVSYRWKNNAWLQIVTSTSNLEVATKEKLGIVMIGSHLLVDASGRISVDVIDEVIEGDGRPVSSGGVYNYVEGKIGDIDSVLSKI